MDIGERLDQCAYNRRLAGTGISVDKENRFATDGVGAETSERTYQCALLGVWLERELGAEYVGELVDCHC